MLKIKFWSKAYKHNPDSWMRNIIKKTHLSIYSQPTKKKKKTQESGSNDIYVSTNKAIIIIKTQNGQVSKAAKNPNKSTTQKQKNGKNKSFNQNKF